MDDKDLQDIIEATGAEGNHVLLTDELETNKEITKNEERIPKDSPKKDKVRRGEAERRLNETEKDGDGQEENDGDDSDPAPGEGLSEEVFEVGNILEHTEDDGCTFYKVHWKGYGEEDDSWEPAENLGSASLAIEKYWKEVNERKGKKKSKTKSVRKSRIRKQDVCTKISTVPHTKNSSTNSVLRMRRSTTQSNVNEDGSIIENISENTKKLPSRTLTKAALKAYDTPKSKSDNDKDSSFESTTYTKKAAIQHRHTWLLDDSDGDSEDSNNEKEENVKLGKENKKGDQEHDNKPRDKDENRRREDRKRKAEEREEKIKKRKPQPISQLAVVNGGNSTRDAIGKKDCTTSISGIAKIDGEIRVCIDNQGRKSVVSVEEAFTTNAWALTHYLISRIQFE